MSYKRLLGNRAQIVECCQQPVLVSKKAYTPCVDKAKLRKAVESGKLGLPPALPVAMYDSRVWNECVRCHSKIRSSDYKNHLKLCATT